MIHTFDLWEKEKSPAEIFDLFPDYREDLEALFKTAEIVVSKRKQIVPPKEILHRIITQLSGDQPVTKQDAERYILQRGAMKGRSSMGREEVPEKSIKDYMGQIIKKIDYMLTQKILLPVGIIAVIVLVLVITQFTGRKPSVSLLESEQLNKDQQALNEVSKEMDKYVNDETVLVETDSALQQVAMGKEDSAVKPAASPKTTSPAASPKTTSNVKAESQKVDATLQTESKNTKFDPELNTFFSEDTTVKETDAALANDF